VSWLVAVPIVVPLIGAALCVLFGRSRATQRVISVLILAMIVVVSVVLLVKVDHDGPVSMQAGGWPAPIGITLIADRLSAIMLVAGAVMLLAVLVYAIGEPGAERNHVGFQSVYLVLAAGVALSLLTGDLFTLFVAFEMMLTASYVLLTLGGRREQVRSGMTYVVISLLASTLFVTMLALVYSATSTVNMADLAVRIPQLPAGEQQFFAVFMLVVFGIKAALFPLFFWLPDSYPTAPGPIIAVFAGLLTKVGVYAIIRTQTLFFPSTSRPATLILVLAGATMLVGVLGAIAQDDMKRILSFTIISQIGFMVMGLGFFTVAGIAAVVFALIHHIVVKTSLFLTGGLIEHAGGSSRLRQLGGMISTAPFLAALFLLSVLSLVGVPPFSGFIAKLALTEAGFSSHEFAIVGVSLLVSLLTLLAMFRIWMGVFWNPAEEPSTEPTAMLTSRLGGPPLMVIPAALLVACSLAIAVAAGPLFALSQRTADDLLHPNRYVHEVLAK
jgi:multicomponent Na+:H+ antiporter subunit D